MAIAMKVLRILVAILPAIGALVENIKGKEKAKTITEELLRATNTLEAANEVLQEYRDAREVTSAGGNKITDIELEIIVQKIEKVIGAALNR